MRRLTLWFAALGAMVALAVAIMTTASVLGRALLHMPVPGDVELTQMGIALAISLGLPWCQLRGSNIIIDFFTQKLPLRSQRLLDAAGALLLVVMYGLLAWRTAAGAISVQQSYETTMILGLPMWWAYAALAPGLALAALIALIQAMLLAGGRPLQQLSGEAA